MDSRAPWRARVCVGPGVHQVAELMQSLAGSDISVPSMFVRELEDERQLVEMFMQAPMSATIADIREALQSVSSDVMLARGERRDIEDIAGRVLQLSTRLIEDPELAPRSAADLLLADEWQVVDATEGENSSAHVIRLQWTPDRHIILRRAAAPFTVVERERAADLLRLVETVARVQGVNPSMGWVDTLRDGQRVWTRFTRPDDVAGVAALHERCSENSRFQRYFTTISAWREENLRRLSGGHRGATVVVTDDDDVVIGLGNVFPEKRDDETVAEIALIIDDAHHGLGVGTALFKHLLAVARRLGFDTVVAYVLAENTAMLSLLDNSELEWMRGSAEDLGSSVVAFSATL